MTFLLRFPDNFVLCGVPMPSRRTCCFALVLLLGLMGCSPGVGTVTGEVKVKGKDGEKAIPDGVISFYSQERKKTIVNRPIKDGKYEAPNVPAGKVKVTVRVIPPPTVQADPKAKNPSKDTPLTIAKKYSDPSTTDLEYTITTGPQEISITLDP